MHKWDVGLRKFSANRLVVQATLAARETAIGTVKKSTSASHTKFQAPTAAFNVSVPGPPRLGTSFLSM
jgi:hypothetical protein